MKAKEPAMATAPQLECMPEPRPADPCTTKAEFVDHKAELGQGARAAHLWRRLVQGSEGRKETTRGSEVEYRSTARSAANREISSSVARREAFGV